jgi:hypothetical protein
MDYCVKEKKVREKHPVHWKKKAEVVYDLYLSLCPPLSVLYLFIPIINFGVSITCSRIGPVQLTLLNILKNKKRKRN